MKALFDKEREGQTSLRREVRDEVRKPSNIQVTRNWVPFKHRGPIRGSNEKEKPPGEVKPTPLAKIPEDSPYK